MPLFFVVGGYANARSWHSIQQRGGGYADFVQHRLMRLLRPVILLLAVWLPLAILLDVVWTVRQ